MNIQQLLKSIEIIGAISFFGGLIILICLQLKISKRLNKCYFTFLSVFKIPADGLSESDKRLRKIGGYLLFSGGIILIISNFLLYGVYQF